MERRLIDANALLDAMRDEEFQTFVPLDEIDSVIDKAPTIDAEPVVHARWQQERCIARCTWCGRGYRLTNGGANVLKFLFCPNCGAKMDGGAEG